MSTPRTAPQLRPLRVGEILDVCINIFTKNFLTFLKIVLVLVVPVQLVTVLILVSTVSDPDLLPKFGSTNNGGRIAHDDVPAYLGGQVVILVLTAILYAIAIAACFRAVGDAYLGSRPDWRSSLRFAVRRFHSVLWVTFLVYVASTFGLIGLIVLGVWLWFSFSVSVPALLFEGLKGRRALARSFRLVRGRWWATAGAIFSAYLIAGIIGGILQSLISALVLTDAGNSVAGVATVNAVANGIGQLFTTPFPAAVTAVVYYDLRVRKEGFDLQLLAERLGVTPPEGAAAGAFPTEPSVPVWERPAGNGAPPPPLPPPPPPPPDG
ncbi:MAG: hypothetical protein QOC77_2235 [Thermoleophilaceae bacterium]|nr:hypothetical protein [Thermoleophilaceae bacterium]